jgi:hypothetical protein
VAVIPNLGGSACQTFLFELMMPESVCDFFTSVSHPVSLLVAAAEHPTAQVTENNRGRPGVPSLFLIPHPGPAYLCLDQPHPKPPKSLCPSSTYPSFFPRCAAVASSQVRRPSPFPDAPPPASSGQQHCRGDPLQAGRNQRKGRRRPDRSHHDLHRLSIE